MRRDLDRVRLAAELGVLSSHANQVIAANDALALLCGAIQPDAAELLTWDPFMNAHVIVASATYPAAVAEYLRVGMMDVDFYGLLREHSRAMSIDGEDTPVDFRQTPHYQDVLEPAGFHDGMSAPLIAADGRYTGMMHMSTAASSRFTAGDRSWLNAVSPALAHLVDFTRSSPLERLPTDSDAALLSRAGTMVPLPGRRMPAAELVTALVPFVGWFLDSGSSSVTFLMEWAGTWRQVGLMGADTPPEATPSVIVSIATRELPHGLTAREVDVLTRLAIGESNHEIAADLFVSVRTVTTHVERILGKLCVTSRAGAAGKAVREGLVRPHLTGEPDALVGALFDVARRGPISVHAV
ncbi:MAG: response regulator receiver protein [Acidimicrobiaceae bacterium]|nr:MAG: response regulator receiver protein [Acidimicrobiaceae bacterium]